MKEKILSILMEADSFISGEEISRRLGISRTAVWKHINSLKNSGYSISSSTNKGYILENKDSIYNKSSIEANINTKFIGKSLVFFDELDSTNSEAKRRSNMPDGTVFVANIQTNGRGRMGREWKSGEDGIWFSILLKPNISPAIVSQITLVAGLAVSSVIDSSLIKWPNDCIICGKKVSGILTEMSTEDNMVTYVVCGIGINLNDEAFSSELSDVATSIYIEEKKKRNKAEFLGKVLTAFEKYYTKFLEDGFTSLANEYKEKCVNIGRVVKVIKNGEDRLAEAIDISNSGELIVKTDNKIETIYSGEVSVRGVYGYI